MIRALRDIHLTALIHLFTGQDRSLLHHKPEHRCIGFLNSRAFTFLCHMFALLLLPWTTIQGLLVHGRLYDGL